MTMRTNEDALRVAMARMAKVEVRRQRERDGGIPAGSPPGAAWRRIVANLGEDWVTIEVAAAHHGVGYMTARTALRRAVLAGEAMQRVSMGSGSQEGVEYRSARKF